MLSFQFATDGCGCFIRASVFFRASKFFKSRTTKLAASSTLLKLPASVAALAALGNPWCLFCLVSKSGPLLAEEFLKRRKVLLDRCQMFGDEFRLTVIKVFFVERNRSVET
jgi:hypothetical protein